MKRLSALVILSLTVFSLKAQDFSNKGRLFYISYAGHIDGTASAMGIYITSDVAATGQVTVGSTIIPYTVAANSVKRIFLGPTTGGDAPNTAVYLGNSDLPPVPNAAIKVTADKPVAVYAHIIRSARSGATLVLPVQVWGKSYVVPSYRNVGASASYGEINVMSSDTNTVVEITPSVPSRNGARAAGVPFTITLNPGEVYQLQFQSNADISGTKVRSIGSGASGCKPIAVFSATTWSAFDCTSPQASGGDNLYQQLFPLSAWGKNFLTAPYKTRNSDIVRVFVSDPTTIVQKTENGVVTTLTGLVNSAYYEYKTSNPTKLIADKAISVVHYITSQSCGSVPNTNADPEMIILNPLEQTINNITVFSAHQNYVPSGQSVVSACYLNIIIKTTSAASFRINGAPPTSAFVSIPATGYSYLQQDVTAEILATNNPVQTLVADSAFSAIAYGFGNVESYGYNAGTNVKDLYQKIIIRNEFATVDFPATCVNTPFNYSITLPYLPTKLVWDFHGNFTNVINNAPVADSSYVIDGKTVYVFRLPLPYTYTTVGTFPVTVVATNASSDGCSGDNQIDYDVQVFDKPIAKWGISHTGCLSDTVRFLDSSNGQGRPVIKWKWNFGDTGIDSVKNPKHLYQAGGSYPVKLFIITDVGCVSDTATKIFTVSSAPVAKFGATRPYCKGVPVVFSDSSTIQTGSLVKWYWDYGNGQRDTLTTNAPRIITYNAAGNYVVKLVVETSSGCKSVAYSYNLTIYPSPVANFTLPQVCLPDSARFTDQSTIPDNSQGLFKYNWSFGDGGLDTLKNPAHLYLTTGPFAVKLSVTSKDGCTDTLTKQLATIYAKPIAAFTVPAELCLKDTTRFQNSSSAALQTITAWSWNFGNSQTSTDSLPVVLYTTAGTYTIKLVITSNKGCRSDTFSQTHVVNPLPTANFTSSTPSCATRQINFTSTSAANAGNITRWLWNMGDATVFDNSNGIPFSYSYAAIGSYLVKLFVSTDKGCKSDTVRKTLVINARPVAKFGLPEVCLSDAFAQFTDSSTIADGTAAGFTYSWNFNDPNATPANPNTAAVANPRHKYAAIGIYNVSLIVISSNGCADTLVRQLVVNGDNPVSNFNFVSNTGTCSNEKLVIQNKATVNFGSITKTQIYWDWVNNPAVTDIDNTPVADELYSHQYPSFQSPLTKTVQVRFLAFSGTLCVDDTIKTVTLYAAPKTQFLTTRGICLEAAPAFITQATEIGGVPGTFTFSGPGITASGQFDPSLAGVGSFTIKYLFVSTAGCRDSISGTQAVLPRPIANFGVSSPTCEGKAIQFSDSSLPVRGILTQWKWKFGDAAVQTNTSAASFPHIYAATGNYVAELQVVTDSGCTSLPVQKTVTVHPIPVPSFTLPTVCLRPGTALFANTSTIADASESLFTYAWQFGDPLSGAANQSVLKDATHNYTSVGPFNVTLTVTSKDGCANTLTQTLTDVNPQPKADFTVNPAAVCIGDIISFTDQSNPLNQTITSLHWDFGDNRTGSLPTISHLYSSAGVYNVKLYARTAKGCNSDTATKTVTVYAFPTVNAGPDLFVLDGGQVQIKATATNASGYTYQWTPAQWLDSATLLQPTTKPLADITYKIKVTAAGGCSAEDAVLVKLLLAPVVPNAFSPNRDGINDTWAIQYLESYPGAVIQLFDRYGKQVFYSVGYNKPFDGKFNGGDLAVGVYYYIIDPKNGRKPITGSLTLLR